MLKPFAYFILSAGLFFTSCDVRKHDQKAPIEAVESTPIIKDSTTVQIIDSLFDFGKATDGEVVEYNYRFKNTGNHPLIIVKATASCGCTVPEKPEQPILPGDTGYLKVKFDTQNRSGRAHKTITVVSNANPSFHELILNGEVIKAE